MAKDHKWFLGRVSTLSTIYGLLPASWQTAVVGMASAVAAYLGFQYSGLFFAFIGAAVVFVCGMMGVFFGILIGRLVGIFGKLAIRDIGVADFGVDIKGISIREIRHLTMNFSVQNNSPRDIHFKCLRAHLSVMNQVNQEGNIEPNVTIVPGGQIQPMLFATLPVIKLSKVVIGQSAPSPMTGKVDLEIAYGPTNENLPYLFSYKAELSFGMGVIQGRRGTPTQTTLKVISSIKSYGHKKNAYVPG